VLDLLCSTTALAAEHERARDILEPFPAVADPRAGGGGGLGAARLALDPDTRDVDAVRRVLRRFPRFETINAAALDGGARELRELMDARDALAWPLLQWITSSNRSHIVSVPAALRLRRVGTRHQFVMLSAPPERQARFDALAREHGSKFAWHGSRKENWHAILRNGLRNASGTKLQLNGAAHGHGIYLSSSAQMSAGYSQMGMYGAGGPQVRPQDRDRAAGGEFSNTFLAGRALTILALCEVADVKTIKKTGQIWVAPDEDCVVTRFLFAFPDGFITGGGAGGLPADSTAEAFEDEVRRCIAGLSE